MTTLPPIADQIADLQRQLEESTQQVFMIRGAIQALQINLEKEEQEESEEDAEQGT